MAGFQTRINQYPAPGVEGAFAGTNPHATYQAGEGALVAGEDGLTVGRFAWAVDGVASNAGSGVPSGFVHRDGQAAGARVPAVTRAQHRLRAAVGGVAMGSVRCHESVAGNPRSHQARCGATRTHLRGSGAL